MQRYPGDSLYLMSTAQAKRVATGVFIVVAAVVAWSEIAEHGKPIPPMKTLVALLVLAAGLAIGVEVLPEIVGPLALLMGLAIVISRIPQGKSKFLSTYTNPEQAKSGDIIRPNPIPGRGD